MFEDNLKNLYGKSFIYSKSDQVKKLFVEKFSFVYVGSGDIVLDDSLATLFHSFLFILAELDETMEWSTNTVGNSQLSKDLTHCYLLIYIPTHKLF